MMNSSTNIRTLLQSKNKNLNNPILVAGFPGAGLVGSIGTNYLIEVLSMYQVACIDSEFIIPGIIYTGSRLRHPFRLYANDDGDICVIVCEAPVMLNGMHSVLDKLSRWCSKNNASQVVVLDGIPIQKLPPENRQALIMHGNGLHQDIYDSEVEMKKIKKEIINQSKPEDANFPATRGYYDTSAFIGGMAGGLLSSCLSYGIPCTAILVPAPSGIPDPGGAAILIESLASITNNSKLRIDPFKLRQEGMEISKHLEDVMKSIKEQKIESSPENKLMYG